MSIAGGSRAAIDAPLAVIRGEVSQTLPVTLLIHGGEQFPRELSAKLAKHGEHIAPETRVAGLDVNEFHVQVIPRGYDAESFR